MSRRPSSCLIAVLALLACVPVQAERADRTKPLVVESDGKKAASVDLSKRTTTVVGNVVITQGTLQIKADKVDVREDAPGRFSATALGSAAQPATFRQKRDRVDEVIEAQALRIEYDGGADRIRLVGEARMRILRAGQPADEATAAVIVYDQPGDTLTFEGGSPGSSAAASRPRLVFVPRAESTEAPR
ncbi:lipopolysaccharide transport periplasmic protein LptA [Ideonella sp. 4Y11]|uniref:Lipopolysaccharide export system protein LptA n=1 Tax=Ideonella aquatica TaxID=2824119 RepID=A0A940YWK2_9BURK|nr:lipopolysaccharide transport periplasmic protein LptA [Ideonella aquatica]MBQ0960550.1 lipopolysaccharide transport periplasmic protein LptA [Ideonella aquatica]